MNALEVLQNHQNIFPSISLVNSHNSTSGERRRLFYRDSAPYNYGRDQEWLAMLIGGGQSLVSTSPTFQRQRGNFQEEECADVLDSTPHEYTSLFLRYAEIDDKSAWREMQSESFSTILDSKLEAIQDHIINAETRLASSADERKVLNSACSIVRGLIRLEMGWDGPDSFAPTEEVINDALTVLRNWPVLSFIPEPSAGIDGSIALGLYDEDNFACGGIELIGNRIAIYSIIDDEKVVCFGRFDTSSHEEMVQALSKFKDYLG
ncbi:MAG: hypothetical protein OXE94_14630 [Aestuariivita sp.]|nr:hypothetical protein [Aestuariivita sp.]MCY4201554.1 hypothetical protein [Aestuariivita sp.]